jgi:hypothetical protein
MAKESLLTTLSKERPGDLDRLSRQSIQWLTNKIRDLKGLSAVPGAIAREEIRHTNKFLLGNLYYFYYDPKGKDDLPYYDKFPLVLAIEKYSDGFLGLNLHYLPLKYRVAFLGKLMNYATYTPENEIKRLRVTYDILQASKRYKEFKPCIKRYLHNHIKSKILAVAPNEWEVATVLPVQQFKKAKPQEVWEDSIKEIKGV